MFQRLLVGLDGSEVARRAPLWGEVSGRRAAEGWEADGLFIGAPGHGRLHDLVFGSDTARSWPPSSSRSS